MAADIPENFPLKTAAKIPHAISSTKLTNQSFEFSYQIYRFIFPTKTISILGKFFIKNDERLGYILNAIHVFASNGCCID